MAALSYRRAIEADLPAIIALLADDILGSSRERMMPDVSSNYRSAFADIEADPNQFLCVVEDDREIIGTFQLTFIPGLARNGAKRGQIEAVRVASGRRGAKVGEAMFAWAIEQCRARGCALVQLTTDAARPDAHRFYDRLGFKPTHVGYKLWL
jgi:GNAT superfamily N-acetyltransferase